GNGSGSNGSGENGSGGNGSGSSGSGENGSGGNGSGSNGSGSSGSQGGNVKDNAKKQGDKLPNTATHYPASILIGLSTFLMGMLLLIRRKNAK
ncbi:LPXTG cell wall anchor domain-containing protein, partial [Bacillus anthracis]|uniref:LPXTG cell wall anchor domain-containing protein n=3 Tax=Bacillus TaxID=1386 RepID=UPI002DC0553E